MPPRRLSAVSRSDSAAALTVTVATNISDSTDRHRAGYSLADRIGEHSPPVSFIIPSQVSS